MVEDIYTEPEVADETLENLGPLTGMAGIWSGQGVDVHPVAEGTKEEAFAERVELQPIDGQTNGPQLYYGLRYHTQVFRPGIVETFHDQVGYWLWEPATGVVMQTLTIPRGQTALAVGRAAPDAKRFTLEATENRIVSNPFLERAFKTTRFTITVTIHDGTWSYEEDSVLVIPGRSEPFHHTDRNTLTRIAEPTPNPRAVAARRG